MSNLNKFLNYFLLFIFVFTNFLFFVSPAFAQASTAYDKLGMSSAVFNSANGKYISGTSPDTVLPYASLTKLMSALVLLDLKINLNKKVIIKDNEINYVNPYIDAGDVTSGINIKTGDKVALNDMWNAMLIASSNEAAIILVDNSGISRAKFVQRMNSKAKAYGLKHTKFTDPTGIDPRNVGTAREMAIIAWHAYAYSSVRTTSAKPSYKFNEINSGRTVSVISRNNSLLAMKPLGMKVGYLIESKINVAVRLKNGAKDRIIVVLHSINNARRNAEICRLMKK
jgi:D-alanyl-D-alanine endopeptidase (penicillin-binding protein 7)